MSQGSPQVQFAMPTLEAWQRNLLLGLFAAYVLELVLFNTGVPLYSLLPWYPLGGGFEVWQPVTRYLVQGASQASVFNVLFGLLGLYFGLTIGDSLVDQRTLGLAFLAGAIGGTLLPLGLDAAGLLPPVSLVMGWTRLVAVPFILLGIARPNQTIFLYLFPVQARWFLWGTLILALLYILVAPVHNSFEMLGVWLGTVGWWYGLGPGQRRRTLTREAAKVRRELKGLQVLEGGKSQPQGGQDETYH